MHVVALDYVDSNFAVKGSTTVIRDAEVRSIEDWAAEEPDAEVHLRLGATSASDPFYGFTFEGTFQVVGPLLDADAQGGSHYPTYDYVSGRIIVDASGSVLSVSLEGPEGVGASPFGDPVFQD